MKYALILVCTIFATGCQDVTEHCKEQLTLDYNACVVGLTN